MKMLENSNGNHENSRRIGRQTDTVDSSDGVACIDSINKNTNWMASPASLHFIHVHFFCFFTEPLSFFFPPLIFPACGKIEPPLNDRAQDAGDAGDAGDAINLTGLLQG